MNDLIRILSNLTAYGFFIIQDDQLAPETATYQAYKNALGHWVIVKNTVSSSVTTTTYLYGRTEADYAAKWTNRATDTGFVDKLIL